MDTGTHRGSSQPLPDLLEQWVAAGLLSAAQAAAIERHESGADRSVATRAGAPGPSLVVEALGYVGGLVMVVGAARRTPGSPASPMLLIMRPEGQITMLDLPSPAPMEDGGRTGISAAGQPIVSLPGGRVLYGMGAEAWSASLFMGYKGWYFARAVIGAGADGDRVDTNFGDNGSAVLSVGSGESDCTGLLNTQKHLRAGVWLGRPTVIGWWSRHCAPEQASDGLLMRLQADNAIFADGFE